jgi:CelD/BcsL family acetyltransferase involved in cellulose biosynthesis
MPAPVLELGARSGSTYEDWFGGRSRNFRQQMRRDRRRLEEEGARFRMTSDVEDLERDVGRFAELHHGRWRGRGGSGSFTPRVHRALVEVGRRLLPSGRFRLWNLETASAPVASHLFLAAGGEVSYWLGGFDERWSSLRPSLQTILVAIEDAWRRGERRMDLGAGGQPYKYRFAESDDVVVWTHVVPPGRRSLVARSLLAVRRGRRELSARLPDRARTAIRAARELGRVANDEQR